MAGRTPGEDVAMAIDAASSEFYRDGGYHLATRGGPSTAPSSPLTSPSLVDRYPIISIEDGMAEEDWDGWSELTLRFGDQIQLVGDDVFVTNSTRLARGIEAGVANAILVKVNQIGTLTETLDTVALATRPAYRR